MHGPPIVSNMYGMYPMCKIRIKLYVKWYVMDAPRKDPPPLLANRLLDVLMNLHQEEVRLAYDEVIKVNKEALEFASLALVSAVSRRISVPAPTTDEYLAFNEYEDTVLTEGKAFCRFGSYVQVSSVLQNKHGKLACFLGEGTIYDCLQSIPGDSS